MAFCRVEYGSLWDFRSFLLFPLPFLLSPPHTPPTTRADVLLDYVKHFPFPGTDLSPHKLSLHSSTLGTVNCCVKVVRWPSALFQRRGSLWRERARNSPAEKAACWRPGSPFSSLGIGICPAVTQDLLRVMERARARGNLARGPNPLCVLSASLLYCSSFPLFSPFLKKSCLWV